MSAPEGFTKEQQAYLQGLVLGTDVARKIQQLPVLSGSLAGSLTTLSSLPSANGQTTTDTHSKADDNNRQSISNLLPEESAKQRRTPGEVWHDVMARSRTGEFPKGTDVFLSKYHGLFFVAPAQNSYMCRLRLPGGLLRADQLVGLAQLVEDLAGGHVDITTRANLQIREIGARQASELLMGLRDLGIVTLGSGADNIRNVTCSPLSGIDPDELVETLPLARKLHYHILHSPSLFNLPRKFNIAFDGSGRISSLAETNDVSWRAVKLTSSTETHIADGIYFKLGLGGITGHGDFARDTCVIATPDECIPLSDAILNVFIAHGKRDDRKRARLKYLLDDWGFEKFLSEVEKQFGQPLRRLSSPDHYVEDRVDRWAHVGVHRQIQDDLNYIGVVVPAARLTSAQLRRVADITSRFGNGQVRLTAWQNMIIPDIRTGDISSVQQLLTETNLDWRASTFQAGMVACTGNAGCKFAAADTKRHSLELAEYLQAKFQLEQPINIHVTGCHHSCAQHAIGDIGLIACKVEVQDEMVEGYHILVGGRTGADAAIGRLLVQSVPASHIAFRVAEIIEFYLLNRSAGESFATFAAHSDWQSFVNRNVSLCA